MTILKLTGDEESSVGRVVNTIKSFYDKMEEYANKSMTALPDFWVAGGAVRDTIKGLKPTDYDLFFSSVEDLSKMESILDSTLPDARKIVNDNAVMYFSPKIKIDLVSHLFESPEETIKYFDFTAAAVAVTQMGELICMQDALIDIASNKLSINGTLPHPISTMKRLVKYVKKGYQPCIGTMIALTREVVNVDKKELENESTFYMD